MPFEKDDPRLTAFALGELPTDERNAARDEVMSNHELQMIVDETQATARLISHALLDDKVPITTAGLATILDHEVGKAKVKRRLPSLKFLVSAAAVLVFGVIGTLLMRSSSQAPDNLVTFGRSLAPNESDNYLAEKIDGQPMAPASRGGSRLKRFRSQGRLWNAEDALRESLSLEPADQSTASPGIKVETRVPQSASGRPEYAKDRMPGEFRFMASVADAERAAVQFPEGKIRSLDGLTEKENPAGGEEYAAVNDNPFFAVKRSPLSTFSIDVDTASYANVRRFLNDGSLPPRDAVRIEELINYFTYEYSPPDGDDPFSIHVEVAQCPWNLSHRLVRIGLKGKEIAWEKLPPSNLVFLVDVSGSMDDPNKLPLLKSAMRMLVEKLRDKDRVAIVTYASGVNVALRSTSCDRKREIIESLDRLVPGGSTNGSGGIQVAYEMARANFIGGGTNRVILATDGDFNVGITDQNELTRLIQSEARTGVFLSVLGFGMGNLKDATLEQLADKGNGNYAYIDTLSEARKVLVDQMAGTLATIAKDVKIQVEFNPARAEGYRLIGYENRLMRHEDFHNDAKDAGEIGAGHSVTALYEVVPAGSGEAGGTGPGPLKYQKEAPAPTPAPAAPLADEGSVSRELLSVRLRYKKPTESTSKLIERGIIDNGKGYAQSSRDLQFAAAVASFGMLLRNSPYKGTASFDSVIELAGSSLGPDTSGLRKEFVDLARKAKQVNISQQ